MWQSDNDDDGNKGVRINYVMEYGNYGYSDEMTGAGWNSPRTNMETEIPLRHWHQNDPGTIPNLLQTGAGSPTGIIVNEGTGLGPQFTNQIIHCDAGPRTVRAYPVENDGAGYKATIVDLLTSTDNWYRPADVNIAPDGSLYVADWYDAGVGGHGMADHERGKIMGRVYRVAAPDGAKPRRPNPISRPPPGPPPRCSRPTAPLNTSPGKSSTNSVPPQSRNCSACGSTATRVSAPARSACSPVTSSGQRNEISHRGIEGSRPKHPHRSRPARHDALDARPARHRRARRGQGTDARAVRGPTPAGAARKSPSLCAAARTSASSGPRSRSSMMARIAGISRRSA